MCEKERLAFVLALEVPFQLLYSRECSLVILDRSVPLNVVESNLDMASVFACLQELSLLVSVCEDLEGPCIDAEGFIGLEETEVKSESSRLTD